MNNLNKFFKWVRSLFAVEAKVIIKTKKSVKIAKKGKK
jgi:hypothetical protein